MIKAVLFDLYETLITEIGTPQTRAGALGERFGLDALAFRKAWKPYRPQVIRGELSFARALKNIGDQLGVPLTPSAIARACETRVREKAAVFARIDPELIGVVRTLREHGIRLAVLSNGFAEDVQPWAGCAFQPYFQSTIFSCAYGVAKPDPAVYVEALRHLGTAPEESLFIGDGGDDELEGALRAGLEAAQAVWYVDRGSRNWNNVAIPRIAQWNDIPAVVAPRA